MDNIESIVQSTLVNFNRLIDANNMLGTPVLLEDGTVLIPISRISLGFFTGGGEYGENAKKSKNENQYAGGGGGGVTITPIGFLSQKQGSCKFIAVNENEEEENKWMNLAKGVLSALKK